MEIRNEHQAALVQGVESSKFGFEMNAKMYDILISKMYTNKPAAVIRELSANAWDAHVEAGNADRPFDLHLPTWLDKTFYIRDYGTGIPHEKFEHIYTNVGASTKEDTNDLIGGFGLGSKTPFTMTDTFMVENVHGGRKSTWICFKDKGEPQVSQVAIEDSDEHSGLKVSFSFDEGDVPEFTRQVPIQLRYFPVRPNITGGEGTVQFADLPDGWENQDYFYTGTTNYGNKNYVVMGNVCYKLESSEFDYNLRSLFDRGLTIKVPIGAVDIPPSREHLEMTPRTKKAIMDVLLRIKKEYMDDTQARLDKCSTEWEARKVVFDLNGSLINDHNTLMFNGKPVPWVDWRRAHVTHVCGMGTRRIVRRYQQVYKSESFSMRSAVDGSLEFYVNDLGQGFSKHINDVYNQHDTNNMVIFHVDTSPKATHADRVKEAVSTAERELGVKPKMLSSVFGMPPVVVRQKGTSVGKSEPNQVFKLKGSCVCDQTPLRHSMDEQSDLPKDGYYLELHNWSIKTPIPQIRRLLDQGILQFLDKPVYLVRSKTIKKLDDSMTLLTVDHLKAKKSYIVDKHKEIMNLRALLNKVHRVQPLHKKILPFLKDDSIKAYIRWAAWVLKRKESWAGSPQTLHRILFGEEINHTPDLGRKIDSRIAAYEPIHSVVSQLTSGWSTKSNEKMMDNLLLILQENT